MRASAQQGSPTESRHARHGPSENRGLAAGRAPSSDLDVEAELDVTPAWPPRMPQFSRGISRNKIFTWSRGMSRRSRFSTMAR